MQAKLRGPVNYSFTHAVGAQMRAANITCFEYFSARSLRPVVQFGALTPDVFCSPPLNQVDITIKVRGSRVTIRCHDDNRIWKFRRQQYEVNGQLPPPACVQRGGSLRDFSWASRLSHRVETAICSRRPATDRGRHPTPPPTPLVVRRWSPIGSRPFFMGKQSQPACSCSLHHGVTSLAIPADTWLVRLIWMLRPFQFLTASRHNQVPACRRDYGSTTPGGIPLQGHCISIGTRSIQLPWRSEA